MITEQLHQMHQLEVESLGSGSSVTDDVGFPRGLGGKAVKEAQS